MSQDNPDDVADETGDATNDDATTDDSIDVDAESEPESESDAGGESVPVEEGRKRIAKSRERLEEEADKAVDQFDQGIVDLLSWVLDTETRARIYVYLRKHPSSTSEEIAEGTGLYPSTVRESLAELHDEENVERRKRESSGAGNNPYEYTAIAPSDLVGGVVGQIQDELNTVFNLDDHLGRESDADAAETTEPVSIQVEDDESSDESDGTDADAASEESADSDATTDEA